MKFSLIVGFGLVASGIGTFAALYSAEMRSLRTAMAAVSVARTSHGPIPYLAKGKAASVLVIHGAGGGHDQGRLLAETFLPNEVDWVAPSRFGYLGAPMPVTPSTAAQADAFSELLDHLGVERVVVLAMSGGVPPALQFALRHPDRTRGLVLLSPAPFAPLTAADQRLPVPLPLYNALFASDLPIWLLLRTYPKSLWPAFDVRRDLGVSLDAAERSFVDRLVETFLPVTDRVAGLRNEGAAIEPAAAIDLNEIAVPALVVHARDDSIAPFSTGAFTADRLKRAEFMTIPEGGHLLLGHHKQVRERIGRFIKAIGESSPP